MTNPPTIKPARPFGVTLAILLCILFFAIIPSLTILSRIMIERHIASNNTFIMPDGTETTIISGGTDDNIQSYFDDSAFYQQMGISLFVVIFGIFAWRGKPAWIRYAFMAIVLIISATLIYQNLVLFQSSTDLQGGTGQTLFDFIRNSNILFLFLLPLYVIWYLNRAPARAFYRGYYLKEEIEWLKEQAQDA
jgi:hypothetical protein